MYYRALPNLFFIKTLSSRVEDIADFLNAQKHREVYKNEETEDYVPNERKE